MGEAQNDKSNRTAEASGSVWFSSSKQAGIHSIMKTCGVHITCKETVFMGSTHQACSSNLAT